jgi:hypothetical protein
VAAIAWSDVTGFASGLTAVGAGARTDILNWVNNEGLSAANFGGEDSYRYRLARIYLAAHLGELALPQTASDAVASKTVSRDSLSVTYASATTPDLLIATQWGGLLKDLIEASPAAVGFVTGDGTKVLRGY